MRIHSKEYDSSLLILPVPKNNLETSKKLWESRKKIRQRESERAISYNPVGVIHMNNKININPSSTKWLEKDDRVVADYFCDLGFRSLKQILDMRVFDLMNMQGLNAVRVEEVIICLYKWLNPNTAIDEAIYNGMMSQPFLYTPWRKEHKDLAAIKVGDLVLTPGINMKAIQHFYDAIRKAFFKSEEYNWRWYKFRNRSEYVTYLRKHEEAE